MSPFCHGLCFDLDGGGTFTVRIGNILTTSSTAPGDCVLPIVNTAVANATGTVVYDLVNAQVNGNTLDLEAKPSVPADSALVVVSGAKQDFSRAELGRLDDSVFTAVLGKDRKGFQSYRANSMQYSWNKDIRSLRPGDSVGIPVVIVDAEAEHQAPAP